MTNFAEYKKILEAETVTIHDLLGHFKKDLIDYDEYGNIIINHSKDTDKLPVLVAHLDNVLVGEREPVFDIYKRKIYSGKEAGIGFDDKAGIIAIIELWKRIPNAKDKFRIIFTSNEEVGGIGAGQLSTERYKNAQYMVELDRKGARDLIQTSGCTQLCDDRFAELWVKKGFKRAQGTFTDLNVFKGKAHNICMCNLSIGYYNPHTNNEYLDISEFERTITKVQEFIIENEEVEFKDETPEIKTNYNWFRDTSVGNDFCDMCGYGHGEYYVRKTDMSLCEDCYNDYLKGNI